MERFIQKICLRRTFAYSFLLLITISCSLTFFITTVNETLSIGKQLIGEERYTARINDSYLFSVAILLLATLPLLIPINLFFKRYIKIIQTLSITDMEKLEKQNEVASFFNKYLPGYIIKDESVIFFKFFNTTEIQFMDIKEITLLKGKASYYIYIKTNDSTFIGAMAENIESLSYLINYASQSNKSIIFSMP